MAGAGSGKTRVIITRIVRLLREGVPPESILGVTFTNKAAEEMRSRIREALPRQSEVAESVTLCTFHALGLRIMEEFGHLDGLPRRFTILDVEDQHDVIRSVIEAEGLDPELVPARQAAQRISAAKNGGLSADQLRSGARTHQERLVARLMKGYEEMLASLRAVDFDDLLCKPRDLLVSHPEVQETLAARYRQIMVDEYQDTNQTQLALLRLLSDEGHNLVVVGDDDQSIYGWRGACLDNILEFEQHFPHAVVLRLTENYRSTRRVLALANVIIDGARRRRPKELWTAGEEGPMPRRVVCATPQEEADYVAQRVSELKGEEGLPYHEIGVLMRTNGQAREFEEALRFASIPYRLVGGTSFFERREVKDALAYLRILANRHDELALRRAVATPSRGIGAVSLARLADSARQHIEPLFEAFKRAERVAGVPVRTARAAARFAAEIERFAAEIEQQKSLAETARRIFDEMGLIEALRSGEGGRKVAAAEHYVANIESLLASLADYEERSARPELADYLKRIALDTTADDSPETGRVTLMTLHAAKGLEFQAVFLVGLEEGLLPHQRSIEEVDGDDDEERRLFYVGVTRARRHLMLSRCRRRRRFQRDEEVEESRFMRELVADLFGDEDRHVDSEKAKAARAVTGFRNILEIIEGKG